jgi:hypothetical protein
MDLATGTFINTPTEEAGDEDASSLGDDAADGEDKELEDEVPGEFEAPSIPNDDINLLLAQHTTQVEGTQDTSPVAARTPTVTARPPTVAMTPMPTSRGYTLARPLVPPYECRGSNRNNPQHEGLMQMMQMSMLQHNQYLEEEHQHWGEEGEDRLAMQQMLGNAVGGAFAALNRFRNNEEE